jgi:hypothetical protein
VEISSIFTKMAFEAFGGNLESLNLHLIGMILYLCCE